MTSYEIQVSAVSGVLPELYTNSDLPQLTVFQDRHTAGGSSTALFASASAGQRVYLGSWSPRSSVSQFSEGVRSDVAWTLNIAAATIGECTALEGCPQETAACDSSCRTCSGPGPSQCTSCNSPSFLDRDTSQCVSVCPTGTFEDTANDECSGESVRLAAMVLLIPCQAATPRARAAAVATALAASVAPATCSNRAVAASLCVPWVPLAGSAATCALRPAPREPFAGTRTVSAQVLARACSRRLTACRVRQQL